MIGISRWQLSLARAAVSGAIVLAAATLGLGAVGCGSGEEGTTAESTGHAGAPSTAKVPTAGGSHRQQGQAGSRSGGGKESTAKSPAASKRPEEDVSATKPTRDAAGTRVQSHSSRCPAAITREQCTAFAKQAAKHLPSHALNTAGDCLQAMSKARCEAMLTAQKAAQGDAGASVDVEHCLEEETRARCEAQLSAQLEAQYAASRQAGK